MLTVGKDEAGLERRLGEGRLRCPDRDGELGPWGRAGPRTIWGIGWWRRIRPRRPRCRRTHVLAPVNVLWHRREDVSVIGQALTRSALGEGFRSIARVLERPEATVRGWIRRMRQVAEPIWVAFMLVRARLGGRGDRGSAWALRDRARSLLTEVGSPEADQVGWRRQNV